MLPHTLLIALFLLTAPFLETVVFSQETLVALEDLSPAELCPSCTTVTFLIKTGKRCLKLKEAPHVELVSLGGDRKNVQGFTAEWIGPQKPRAIKVTVDTKELVRSGTYDVYLNLQPISQADAPRLKVQILHPPPKIAPIPKLILDRTYWFIWTWTDTHPELFLHEVSKKSNITNLIIDKTGNASIGTRPIGGTLQVSLDPLKSVRAGEHKKIEYSLANDFDLGTATGTLKIESSEMIDSLGTVDFEVRSHVHWIYIGLTIGLGLICSYFLKVRLQQRLELGQAQVDARKLVERVAMEEQLHEDPVFVNAYKQELRQLITALTETSPADINNAKTALDTAWRKALQDLTKRHQDQLDALDKLRDITSIDWLVPPTVNAEVQKASAAVDRIVSLIERDDLTQADRIRRQTVLNLGDAVIQAAFTWQSDEHRILELLQGQPNGLSQTLAATLAKPAQELATLLKKIGSTPVQTPEQVQQVLSDVKSERLAIRQFVDWLKQTIRSELSTAEDFIRKANVVGWDVAVFATLPQSIEAFIASLEAAVDTPDRAKIAAHLHAIHQAWTDALQNQFQTPNTNVDSSLGARKYVEAVRAALQAKGAPVPLSGRQPAAFTPSGFQGYVYGAAAPLYSVRTRFTRLFTAPPTQPTSFTAETQLKKDKFMQSLIIGLLLIVAGYGLQLNTFVGTFIEFSTLFFWAFGLDLTVEAIRGTTKRSA